MKKLNEGLIFTTDKCIGCNRCISGCPIPGANIARQENGKNSIIVDKEKCIHCGHCLSVCQHGAREYYDDTTVFFNDLRKGESISLAVAPSFYLDYPEDAPHILGYLKSSGINKIYNVSVGADIATWANVLYLKNAPQSCAITNPCAAVVNYIEKQCPDLLSTLIPVQSPLMCLARYVRTKLGNTDKIAFLSPCIAKKDEINDPATDNLVQYNVTFKHLMEHIGQETLTDYYAEPDIGDSGLGALYPLPGGMKDSIDYFLPEGRSIIPLSTPKTMSDIIKSIRNNTTKSMSPVIFEPLYCEFGCTIGPGAGCTFECLTKMLTQHNNSSKNLQLSAPDYAFDRALPPEKRWNQLQKHFQNLDPSLFRRSFSERYEQPFLIPDDILEDIFKALHKMTPESRHIDCHSCGYASCHQMAEAIASGYNTINNCIQYEKDENLRLFTTDHLTGLPNKYVLMKTLTDMLSNGTALGTAAVYFNIKNFILINNQFGYEEANTVLAEFANTASAALLPGEQLFHHGGDSFIALLKRERINRFIFSLNHLRLSSLETHGVEVLPLSVRCGIYILDGKELDAETILNRLSSAFLITKTDKHIDVSFYDKTASSSYIDSLVLSQQIPRALDNGEFFIVYQPKVLLSDHTLIGAEALIRWHCNGKIFSPDRFVPVCESSGFIRRIDFYVLNRVCQKLTEWIKSDLNPVKISVNFSKLHFLQPDVAERICNIIDKWRIPHNLIEIEFTETLYTDEKKNLKTTLHALKDFGISSSIDDFGSGYSSLSLLQDLDFDVLKLDKSLIDTMLPDVRAQTVVTNIVRMAKDLDMDVVAEGVESKDMLNVLADLNCDIIQGFVFDRPLSEEEFEKRMKQRQYKL